MNIPGASEQMHLRYFFQEWFLNHISFKLN